MTVSLSYQAWSAANYVWNASSGTTHAAYQINDLLKNWVLAVNNNPSNGTRRITLEREPANTTAPALGGWVFKVESPVSNSILYSQLVVSNSSNLYFAAGSTWTSGTSLSGYGVISGNSTLDASNTFYTTGYVAEFAVASSIVDGQEFFAIGWRMDNTMSVSDYFLLFKDTTGEWALVYNDSGSIAGAHVMTTHPQPRRAFGTFSEAFIGPTTNGYFAPPYFYTQSTTYAPTTSAEWTIAFMAANPNLYVAKSATDQVLGRWAYLNNATEKIVCIGRNLYVKLPA